MWFGSVFAFVDAPSRRRVDRRTAARRQLLESLEDRVVLTFAAPTIYPLGSSPSSLVAADFTGDGILDVANHGGVLVSNGDGSFKPRLSPVLMGQAGDVDGDGATDLIATGVDKLYMSINNGDGTFQPAQPVTLPLVTPPGHGEPLPQSIDSAVVGDLNGDGLLDLVVTGKTIHEVSSGPYGEYGGAINTFANVLMGTGLGTFDTATHYLGFGGGTYFFDRTEFTHPSLGDFNGDGHLDLLMSQVSVYFSGGGLNSYSALSVRLGNGDGTLQPAQVTSTYPGPHSFQLPADFNEDSRTDVLIDGETNNTKTVALANADGTFTLMNPFLSQYAALVGEDVGDVNGDGKLDLVFVNKQSFVEGTWADVLLGKGDGTFTKPVTYFLGSYDYVSPTLADFNGDGFADLAAADRNGGVIVHMNSGSTSPPAPELRITDASVAEGNTGSKSMAFTVTLTHAATGPVTARYSTANGTAASGTDYNAASATLTFAPGETSKTINVAILGDQLFEPNETFTVNLSNPSGASITDGTGVGTIVNDDASLPLINVTDAQVVEGNSGTRQITFTVSLSAASSKEVSVTYATANETAKTSNNDYLSKSGTLRFAPGERTKTITITVNGDTKVEQNETFKLKLSGAKNSTIDDSTGVGTILNDDSGSTRQSSAAYAAAVDSVLHDLLRGRSKSRRP